MYSMYTSMCASVCMKEAALDLVVFLLSPETPG